MKYLKRIILIDKNFALAHCLMAEIFLDKKQYDKAHMKLQDAKKIDAQNSDILYMQGRYYQEIGNMDRAIKFYQKCLASNQNQE